MKPPPPQSASHAPSKRRKITTTSASDPQPLPKFSASSSSNHGNNASKPTKKSIRKTAHSLIERRRRSKMNDAFSTLKDMVPACRGGDDGKEMHKLDVLNAGIEYLGYLERCLERVNERRWDRKGRMAGREEEGGEGEEGIGDIGRERRSASVERQQEDGRGQLGDQRHRERKEEWKTQTMMDSGNPPASARTCHCPCPSHPHEENDARRTLPPPTPPPSSLDAGSTPFVTAQPALYMNLPTDTDRDRERDRDRDHEEATNTAAALLMLTSTDRRRHPGSKSNLILNRTTDSEPSSHPVGPVGSGHAIWKPSSCAMPAVRGGLSVRDLLLK